MTRTTALAPVLAGYIAAVNAFDEDAIVATFGDRVTIELTEIVDHHGDTIVRGRYDGDYDKTNLPDELVLTSYFTVRNGKIVTLIVIRNTPASY